MALVACSDVSRATVLVQGDTGPGNFLADDGVVTGLVDWEFAHVGDPMDDWAWVEMRVDAEEIPALHDRYTRDWYPDRSGSDRLLPDRGRLPLRDHDVARGEPWRRRGWAPYLLQTQRYLDGIAARLSARLGVDEHPVVPTASPTARSPHFDALLDGVRAAVRHLDDTDVREHTRNLQILVRYLRA